MSSTVVEVEPKSPFSIATKPRRWEGPMAFPRQHFVIFDPYLIMLSVKPSGLKYYFWVFRLIDLGLNTSLLNSLLNTVHTIHYTYHHHHHHIVLVARISLTLSRHSSLSFIALGRSSGQHPVSSHSCWMYARAGRPAFARPCVGIHKSTSLMSSSLLLQQCPACLVRLTWIVFVIGGRWPYSWCPVGCCCQDLFRIARSILV